MNTKGILIAILALGKHNDLTNAPTAMPAISSRNLLQEKISLKFTY